LADVTAGMITGKETVEFLTFAQDAPPPGCINIDITLCGICGTDIASFCSGHLHSPSVCGHEWVGTVSDVGHAVDGVQEGDRVVIAVPPACGRCAACRSGLAEHCLKVSAVARGRDPLAPPHGGFAPSITVEAARVIRAHPDLTDEDAAQVEPATVAFHGVRRSRIAQGDIVVVQGAGPIGLFATQFAHAAGAGQVVIVEPSEARRRIGLELGASSAITPEEAADAVSALTDGIGADVVIECAGVPSLLQTAVDLARPGGLVSLAQLPVAAGHDQRRSVAGHGDHRRRLQRLHPRRLPPQHDVPLGRPGQGRTPAQPNRPRASAGGDAARTVRGAVGGHQGAGRPPTVTGDSRSLHVDGRRAFVMTVR